MQRARDAAVDTDEDADTKDEVCGDVDGEEDSVVAARSATGIESDHKLEDVSVAAVADDADAEFIEAVRSLRALSGKKEATTVAEALKTLRAAGGDRVMEAAMERRLMKLAKLGKSSKAPSAL